VDEQLKCLRNAEEDTEVSLQSKSKLDWRDTLCVEVVVTVCVGEKRRRALVSGPRELIIDIGEATNNF
jgi:hypothetical protein